MKQIWKFSLALIDLQSIMMPAGAQFLTVQMQHDGPKLWALCDPDARMEGRPIAIYGTGNLISDPPGKHVATFQMEGGAYIWHVFDPRGVAS